MHRELYFSQWKGAIYAFFTKLTNTKMQQQAFSALRIYLSNVSCGVWAFWPKNIWPKVHVSCEFTCCEVKSSIAWRHVWERRVKTDERRRQLSSLGFFTRGTTAMYVSNVWRRVPGEITWVCHSSISTNMVHLSTLLQQKGSLPNYRLGV